MRDSTPRPCACKAPALATAPIARKHRKFSTGRGTGARRPPRILVSSELTRARPRALASKGETRHALCPHHPARALLTSRRPGNPRPGHRGRGRRTRDRRRLRLPLCPRGQRLLLQGQGVSHRLPRLCARGGRCGIRVRAGPRRRAGPGGTGRARDRRERHAPCHGARLGPRVRQARPRRAPSWHHGHEGQVHDGLHAALHHRRGGRHPQLRHHRLDRHL